MRPNLACDIDEIQYILARGVRLLPPTYLAFIEALDEQERARKVCLLPSTRFEVYHKRLERKVLQRIDLHRKTA